MKSKVIAAVFALAATMAWANDGLSDAARAWLAERGEIVFACQTSYPPSEFVDSGSGEYTGMSVELIRWIATEYGFSAIFKPLPFAAAQKAVLDGSADALTGLFKSDERSLRFDFSDEVFSVPASIFTRAERSDIREASDLVGKRVAVQRGDYAIEYLAGIGARVELVYASDFSSALDLVASGEADAMIGDEQIVLYLIHEERLGERIKKSSGPLYVGQDCMAVVKGDAMLLSVLNAGIAKARSSGTLSTIYKKWMGVPLEAESMTASRWRIAVSMVAIVAVAAGLTLAHRRWRKTALGAARAELETTVSTLRAENENLAAANARLRRDIEERSRLEEDKRRIDAETSARRVEELTRCAIATALDAGKRSEGEPGER